MAKITHYPKKNADLMVGSWRLEVKPTQAQANDIFVHVLEVGDKGTLKRMHAATLEDKGSTLVIDIQLDKRRSAQLTISKSKPSSGAISIKSDKKKIISEKLSTKIQAQSGVTGIQ